MEQTSNHECTAGKTGDRTKKKQPRRRRPTPEEFADAKEMWAEFKKKAEILFLVDRPDDPDSKAADAMSQLMERYMTALRAKQRADGTLSSEARSRREWLAAKAAALEADRENLDLIKRGFGVE